jgi:Flp pilus assembly pilin Flp
MILQLVRAFSSLRSREEGQTLVEYSLILLMVAVACVTILKLIGTVPPSIFSSVNSDF